jgi:hypothetical protein
LSYKKEKKTKHCGGEIVPVVGCPVRGPRYGYLGS